LPVITLVAVGAFFVSAFFPVYLNLVEALGARWSRWRAA
jgi:hypothetical protein